MSHGTVVKRPGGRTADVTARIHKAILDIIVKDGVAACTFSAVAERAKIERSTLYRRFPDRWDAIIAAVLDVAGGEVMPDLTGSFPEDLRSVLRKLVETLESPIGPAILAIAAELRAGSGSDYSRAYFDQRMAQLAPMFDAAVERGELAPDVDREALFSVAAGAIYFRTFIAARGVGDDFIDMVVGLVCWQYCSPSTAAKLSLPGRLA
jgi:AcrR family transcriptional regulator